METLKTPYSSTLESIRAQYDQYFPHWLCIGNPYQSSFLYWHMEPRIREMQEIAQYGTEPEKAEVEKYLAPLKMLALPFGGIESYKNIQEPISSLLKELV